MNERKYFKTTNKTRNTQQKYSLSCFFFSFKSVHCIESNDVGWQMNNAHYSYLQRKSTRYPTRKIDAYISIEGRMRNSMCIWNNYFFFLFIRLSFSYYRIDDKKFNFYQSKKNRCQSPSIYFIHFLANI